MNTKYTWYARTPQSINWNIISHAIRTAMYADTTCVSNICARIVGTDCEVNDYEGWTPYNEMFANVYITILLPQQCTANKNLRLPNFNNLLIEIR